MTSYIGPPGALAAIRSAAQETTTTDRTSTELRPFAGTRIMQLGRRAARSWAIEYNNKHPRDYAILDTLARWDTSLSWVGALAQATNLLTPEQGAFMDATFAGGAGIRRGVLVAGGVPAAQWAGGPVGGQVNVTGSKPVPVLPGVPVTVSVWAQRAAANTSARLSYWFRDATGAQVTADTISGSSSDDLVRRSWTLTPPDGAATLSVMIRDAAVVTHPQVTWTPGAVEYAPGRGVHRVAILPGSESATLAHGRQALTSATFTILEVG